MKPFQSHLLGSIAEEGSVVTFEELSEMAHELSLDWNMDGGSGMPSFLSMPRG